MTDPTPLDLDDDGSPFTPDDVELCHARTIAVHARPAPAWDEEAVTDEALSRARAALLAPPSQTTPWVARLVEEVVVSTLAVVREHLPVKPDREAAGAAIRHALKTRTTAHLGLSEYDLADVVLDLLPGRSEAEVKAEALREAADAVERIDPEWDSALWIADPTSERGGAYHPVETWLRARADRLAAEGGDDRG